MINERKTITKAGEYKPSWVTRAKSITDKERRPFVYGALVTFSALYYYRPEDFIPGLNYVPMARIAGVIGAVALIFGLLGGGNAKVPRAVKFMWLLLLQMAICVPFAMWRSGAFWTVVDFAKAVIVAMLISMSVTTVRELRRLLFIQVSAIALGHHRLDPAPSCQGRPSPRNSEEHSGEPPSILRLISLSASPCAWRLCCTHEGFGKRCGERRWSLWLSESC